MNECPDRWHRGGFLARPNITVYAAAAPGGWSARGFECRTCGFRTASVATELGQRVEPDERYRMPWLEALRVEVDGLVWRMGKLRRCVDCNARGAWRNGAHGPRCRDCDSAFLMAKLNEIWPKSA